MKLMKWFQLLLGFQKRLVLALQKQPFQQPLLQSFSGLPPALYGVFKTLSLGFQKPFAGLPDTAFFGAAKSPRLFWGCQKPTPFLGLPEAHAFFGAARSRSLFLGCQKFFLDLPEAFC